MNGVINMLNVIDVANYFLKKDKNGELFNTRPMTRNGRTFYEGNARLNKYLHIAQNVWIAKTGQKLIDVDFYAYDNGSVALDVQENYQMLLKNISKATQINFPKCQKEFLDRIYIALRSADVDELIDIDHEDIEWADKNKNYTKEKQKMDCLRLKEQYKVQYANFIWALDRMDVNDE